MAHYIDDSMTDYEIEQEVMRNKLDYAESNEREELQ